MGLHLAQIKIQIVVILTLSCKQCKYQTLGFWFVVVVVVCCTTEHCWCMCHDFPKMTLFFNPAGRYNYLQLETLL